MMHKCVDQDFPCQDPDYKDFDTIAEKELSDPIFASTFVNESQFCTFVQTDKNLQLGDLTYKSYLKGLQGKSGIYHLWIDYDNCDDHETHTMLCVYVGKGLAQVRIDSHLTSKWPKEAQLYVTFNECENRLSKYYEQLFLDVYSFELNKNENPGTKLLFAVWDYERHFMGTESHAVSNLSNVFSLDDI